MLNYLFSFTSFPLLSSCLPFASFLLLFPYVFIKWTSLPFFAHLPTSLLFSSCSLFAHFPPFFPFSLCCTNSTYSYPTYFPLPSFFSHAYHLPLSPLFCFFFSNQLHSINIILNLEERERKGNAICICIVFLIRLFIPPQKIRIHWYCTSQWVLKWKWQYFIIIYNYKISMTTCKCKCKFKKKMPTNSVIEKNWLCNYKWLIFIKFYLACKLTIYVCMHNIGLNIVFQLE